LLGLYLGDGCISKCRYSHRLRIFLNKKQPHVIRQCMASLAWVLPSHRVGLVKRGEIVEVTSYFRGWPALFPQCGPGRKNSRLIELAFWQQILVRLYPEQFIRGCIDSDGCRHRRIVRGKNYPAYSFNNSSDDILSLFCWACSLASIRWRRANTFTISIARRPDVARMDTLVMASTLPEGGNETGRTGLANGL
jgi:hypothetical protein